tara:strand:- start:52207 stop:52812 length:606 start_codon:yes stop_codon:yes gene_type:complete
MIDTNPMIYVVDDDKAVTESITWLLDSIGLEAFAYNSPRQFLEDFELHEGPVCIVLDVRMPEISGLELAEKIMEQRQDACLVFLSAHGDVPTAVRGIKAGAVDFLQKPFDPQIFLDTINSLLRLANERYPLREKELARKKALEMLSPRERETFELLIKGQSSKEIGRSFKISPKTVDIHRANILRKVGVATQRDLIHQYQI